MLGNVAAVAIALFLASTQTAETEPIDWSTVRTWLEQLSPDPRLTALVVMGILAILFLLTVGDQLSGILSWLGVSSPFQRAQPSTDQLERTRKQLLTIVKKEVDRRLATSLHNLVKLDLYMEDQRQRVGNPKFELVPEDTEPGFQAVNRVLHPKGDRPPLNLKLTQKIIEVFERQDIQGKLLILGEPGSGKSTELLQLAKDLVTRVEEDERHPVPVILEISSWNEEPIDKWVASQLKKLYSLPENTTQQWLANNQILLMLDGLDELGLTKQRQCIEQINRFLEQTRTSELVVCCRREEYEAGQTELNALNGAVYLEALREDQIRQYFEDLNRLSLWENIRNNPALRELAEKPLFLFMLVVAYRGNAIRNEKELFDAYIEKQLHDLSNQGTYKTGKEPSSQQTCHYLICLAKQLENISETEFLIEGLQPTWLSSTRQVDLYQSIMTLIFMLTCILIFGLEAGLAIGLILAYLTRIDELAMPHIKPTEKLQWSFHELREILLLWLMLGAITGLSAILLGDELHNELGSDTLNFQLIIVIFLGLFYGLLFLMNLGLNSVSIKKKDRPNQGIRKSIQNALCLGLLGGLLGGVTGRLFGELTGRLFGELTGRLFGGQSFRLNIVLLYGSLGGVSGGAYAVIQHFILRILLTINGYTPWNYARFLEHAVKHRFIQRTGGRYRFVHDLLRKHFAAMPLE